ncbi:MAG: hypothetical protein FJZ05_01435 [Candidatus Nealsonbacteria bacterium]|nr:hypothetical protein [Candidatus Nealsonbacteria bacterium]
MWKWFQWVLLSIIVLVLIVIGIFYRQKEKSKEAAVIYPKQPQAQENDQKNPQIAREKLFLDNAFKITDDLDIYARFFGETNKTCLDANCVEKKEDCIRWNKFKDECYQKNEVCQLMDCKRYKIYCELVVVNRGMSPTTDVSFDANYITPDKVRHFVEKKTYRIEPGKGYPFLWEYDTESANIGDCDYSNLKITK